MATGLGGAAANALWNANGKVVTTVTAGSWMPKAVEAAAVTCTREDEIESGQKYSILTLKWPDIGADSYAVSAVRKPENVAMETTTMKSSVTFRLPRNNFTANRTYIVTINANGSGVDGKPAIVEAEMTKEGNNGEALVACNPVR